MNTEQNAIEQIRRLHPLAPLSAGLMEQRRAVRDRGDAIGFLGTADGGWEEDESLWCFCAAGGSNGHEIGLAHEDGEPICDFSDGETRGALCPACRRPASYATHRSHCYQGDYGSACAYEPLTELRTRCCGVAPVLPNGKELVDA